MNDDIQTQIDVERARVKLEYERLKFEQSWQKFLLPTVLGALGSVTLAGLTFAAGVYLQQQAAEETKRQEAESKELTLRQTEIVNAQKMVENKQNALKLFFEEVVPLGPADRSVPRYVNMLSEAAGDPILRENFLAYATEKVIDAGRQKKRVALLGGSRTALASADPFARFATEDSDRSATWTMAQADDPIVAPSDIADGLPDLIKKNPNEGYAGPDFLAYVLYPAGHEADLKTLVGYVQGTGMRIPSTDDIGNQGPAANEIRIYKAAHRKFAETLVAELRAKGLEFTINDQLTFEKPRLPNGIIEFWLGSQAAPAEGPANAPPTPPSPR